MIHLWQKKGHNSYGALDQHAYVLKMENVNKMNNEIHFHLCGNETIKQTIIAEEKQENYSFYRHETEKKKPTNEPRDLIPDKFLYLLKPFFFVFLNFIYFFFKVSFLIPPHFLL